MSRFLRKRQAGQVLIIVALSFVAITGILVIGIDAGQLYLDRRQLQNAADAGALLGADKLQTLPVPDYTAPNQAAITTIVANLPRTSDPGTCAVSCPATTVPATGYLSIGAGYGIQLQVTTWDSYKVTITHTHSYFLAGALGFAGSQTTAASARALSSTYPFALILLKNDSAGYPNLTENGSGTALTIGSVAGTTPGNGGVFSNESIDPGVGTIVFRDCGTDGDLFAYSEDAAGILTVPLQTTGYEGAVPVAGVCPHPANGTYPRTASNQLPFPSYPEPPVLTDVSHTYNSAITCNAACTTYLCPGTYNSSVTISGLGILLPGVYRWTSGGLAVQGGGTVRTGSTAAGVDYPQRSGSSTDCTSAIPGTPPTDPGVALEVSPANGNGKSNCAAHQLTLAGGATLSIVPSILFNNINIYVELAQPAPWQSVCSSNQEGSNVLVFSGGSNYSVAGTIYAPADNVALGGGGAGTGVGQMVCWTLTVSGGGSAAETYNPAFLPYFRGLIQ